jgi:hypothetical protein
MGAEDERRRLGERAAAVAEQFSLAEIDQMWRSLFGQVISKGGKNIQAGLMA